MEGIFITTAPEALRLAEELEHDPSINRPSVVSELRRLHAENEAMRADIEHKDKYAEQLGREIVKESARTAGEKLRADQMTQQHAHQAALHRAAQERIQELGQMLRENRSKRIVELEAQLEAIGAGGVEPLRRDHFRDATEMVPVGWAISYDGKNPHALWTEGEGDLLDLEVKRQGGTACKMQLYARAEK